MKTNRTTKSIDNFDEGKSILTENSKSDAEELLYEKSYPNKDY
jgi:hypothetical protein